MNINKLLLILPVCALVGCGSTSTKVDKFMSEISCEKLVSTSIHTVYKCPLNEDFATVKTLEPNGKWVNTDDFNKSEFSEMVKDTQNVYIEVISENPNATCKDGYSLRTLLKEPSVDYDWAYNGCL